MDRSVQANGQKSPESFLDQYVGTKETTPTEKETIIKEWILRGILERQDYSIVGRLDQKLLMDKADLLMPQSLTTT
jgi:hypothetical protein